jgi:hypothetical protein
MEGILQPIILIVRGLGPEKGLGVISETTPDPSPPFPAIAALKML